MYMVLLVVHALLEGGADGVSGLFGGLGGEFE
jgi:hypothetical protein